VKFNQSVKGLSVAVLGILTGAMLLIATALMPYWKTLEPETYRASFQAIGPFLGAVMIPLLILAIVLSGVSLAFSRGNRLVWAVAVCSVFAIAPLYGIAHAPVNAVLLGSDALTAEMITALREKWCFLHWIRTCLGLVGLVAAIRGMQK